MILADELLQKGERDAVRTYLEECLSIWTSGQDRLKSWIASIKAGEISRLTNLGR
jgi:hypothetical protein